MNIFTYGSLMFPEVMKALTGQEFSFEDVTIVNFERRGIIGKEYPGLCEKIGSSVNGRVWFSVDEMSIQILDSFEDSIYERRVVNIKSSNSGLVEANIYVVPLANEYMLTLEPWDEYYFKNELLAEYLDMCHQFRTDFMVRR